MCLQPPAEGVVMVDMVLFKGIIILTLFVAIAALNKLITTHPQLAEETKAKAIGVLVGYIALGVALAYWDM